MQPEREKNTGALISQRGISLVEVILGVFLLAIVSTGVLRAYKTNLDANQILKQQTTAVNLATDFIEAIKQSPYTANYTSATENIIQPPGYSVNLQVLATNAYSDNGTNYWPAVGGGNETLQKINITIYAGDKEVYSICSFRSNS